MERFLIIAISLVFSINFVTSYKSKSRPNLPVRKANNKPYRIWKNGVAILSKESLYELPFHQRSLLEKGEYKPVYRAIVQCVPTLKYDIGLNYYLSKTSANSTEIKGNLTTTVIIDDSLGIEVFTAQKDSMGGWSDFIQQLKVPKLCTTLKFFGGKALNSILTKAGINNTDCPIYPGVYVSKGIQTLSFFKDTNVPKVFFYGSYKFKGYLTRRKQILGCIIGVIDLKRPWESD